MIVNCQFRASLAGALGLSLIFLGSGAYADGVFQFVHTSDSHYGLTRKAFRGAANVDATVANAALVSELNTLPTANLPADGGLDAGQPVGPIDFVINTGDTASRAEGKTPAAAVSWAEFTHDYLQSLSLKDRFGHPAQVLVVPGNHDVSNAIGFPKPLKVIDPTAMVEIYNRMMAPAAPKTVQSYDFATDKIECSRDVDGIHMVFITIWPDTPTRAWIENDLKSVAATTPVMIFTHDFPALDPRHLRNPNGDHGFNETDKFENLINDEPVDPDKDGKLSVESPTTTLQRQLVAFLKAHKNIVAWFHGHDHTERFYTYTGPDNDIALNTFDSDSPVKGPDSNKDESKLAYSLVTVDPAAAKMSVREVLWNNPTNPWGRIANVSLKPREN